MTSFYDEVDALRKLASREHALVVLAQLWRFTEGHTEPGWFRTPSTIARAFTYARTLADASGIDTPVLGVSVRAHSTFRPLDPSAWICRAKRTEIEHILEATRFLYGEEDALWQRGIFNLAGYWRMCAMSQDQKDQLARANLMSPVAIATMKA